MRHGTKYVVFGTLAMIMGLADISFADASATVSLNTNVGNGLQLLANTPNQKVQILVAGGASISGEDLNIQISTGTSGPVLTSIDFQTGTIFATDNTFGASSVNQALIATPESGVPGSFSNWLIVEGTTTSSGSVTATGLLATLTIDTTGFGVGTVFPINVLGTHNGNSDFPVTGNSPITPTFPSNNITLISAVPEPASLAVLAVGLLLMCKCFRHLE